MFVNIEKVLTENILNNTVLQVHTLSEVIDRLQVGQIAVQYVDREKVEEVIPKNEVLVDYLIKDSKDNLILHDFGLKTSFLLLDIATGNTE